MVSFKDIPFFYGDRTTDILAKQAYLLFPPSTEKTLPSKWAWGSQEAFNRRYGYLGMVVWSRTHSYHMLILNGIPVLRMWTVWPDKCRVEMSQSLASFVQTQGLNFVNKQSKWFSGAVTITTPEEVSIIMQQLKKAYGV